MRKALYPKQKNEWLSPLEGRVEDLKPIFQEDRIEVLSFLEIPAMHPLADQERAKPHAAERKTSDRRAFVCVHIRCIDSEGI